MISKLTYALLMATLVNGQAGETPPEDCGDSGSEVIGEKLCSRTIIAKSTVKPGVTATM